MVSEKNIWRLEFWQNSPIADQQVKVAVDLQRSNFANIFFFVPDIAKILI